MLDPMEEVHSPKPPLSSNFSNLKYFRMEPIYMNSLHIHARNALLIGVSSLCLLCSCFSISGLVMVSPVVRDLNLTKGNIHIGMYITAICFTLIVLICCLVSYILSIVAMKYEEQTQKLTNKSNNSQILDYETQLSNLLRKEYKIIGKRKMTLITMVTYMLFLFLLLLYYLCSVIVAVRDIAFWDFVAREKCEKQTQIRCSTIRLGYIFILIACIVALLDIVPLIALNFTAISHVGSKKSCSSMKAFQSLTIETGRRRRSSIS
jgi:uncharacterized membrane protein